MGIDGKYGRVTVERGTIGENEPVVVFRAQDRMLPYILLAYYEVCQQEGSPRHHLDRIEKTRQEVAEWQQSHFTKVPTSDMLDPRRDDATNSG